MFDKLLAPLGGLFGSVLDKIWPDQNAKLSLEEVKLKMQEFALTQDFKKMVVQADVIKTEMQAGGLASQWRPILMLTFTAIVANIYFIYPYLSLLWASAPKLTLPPEMWDLLKIGVGGYVIGRSTEKSVREWKRPRE